MTSSHDKIQEVARMIEDSRRAFYTLEQSKLVQFSRVQFMYLQAAEYKLARVELQTKDFVKALDDLMDAYNYVALLVDSLLKDKKVIYDTTAQKLVITQ